VTRFWVLLVLAACSKSVEPPPVDDEHPPMTADEEARGVRLCQAYADRVCACAARTKSLLDTCDLAKGQPSAVRMHLEVLHGAPLANVSPTGQVIEDKAEPQRRGPLNENERRLTEASLRKVIAACVELDARLEPATCPR
jgi:hypothetical protein